MPDQELHDDFKPRLPDACNPLITGYSGFRDWKRQFLNYSLASNAFPNTMPLDRQRARLFNIAGPHFEKFVTQTIQIQDDTTIDAILNNVETALRPQRHDLQQRFALFEMKQGDLKSTNFLQLLRDTVLEAEYPADIPRETLIRDLFIHGLNSEEARRLIYQQDSTTLTVSQCLALVSSYETATFETNNQATISSIASKKKTLTTSNSQSCYFCGGARHKRIQCPAFDKTCSKCGKQGHFSRVCQSREISSVKSPKDQLQVSTTSTNKSDRKFLSVKFNDVTQVSMLVDTGSDITLVSKTIALKCGLSSMIKPITKTSECLSASGQSIKIFGKIPQVTMQVQQRFIVDDVWVADYITDDAIMGRTSLEQFESLEITYGGKLPPLKVSNVNDITTNYKVFDNPKASWNITPVCLIPLKDGSVPISTPSRRYSTRQREFIATEVKKLLENGKIKPSKSPYRSQVVVVEREDGKQRLAIDYSTTVNPQTINDAFPIPLIDVLLDKAAKWNYFSRIDLSAAYHQVPLHPREQYLTAFEANDKLYEFTHIPFGLKNACATFARELQNIIEGLPGVLNYFDDIIIGGDTKEQHDERLHKFLNKAAEIGLSLSSKKCCFGSTSLSWLGHIIENGTRRPDPERLKGFLNFPTPKSPKMLQRYIGIAVYHSQWIPKFSETMAPLFDALELNQFPLSYDCLKAIDSIRKSITSAVLAIPVPGKEMRLETDASGSAVGAILSQDGRPVAYMSHRLSVNERKWSPAELEGYAVILAIRKFKNYLREKFTIISDQKGLVYALNSRSPVKNNKYERWKLEMADLNFEVQYRPGILNVAADALSRCSSVHTIKDNSEIDFIRNLHSELAHPGINRLYHYIIQNTDNIISNLMEKCTEVCKNCQVCAEVKPRWLKPTEEAVLITSSQPWERLAIDFVGPKVTSTDGKRFILTVIDEYTRYPIAVATQDRSSEVVIQTLQQIFSLFGPPQSVHSDRGKEFLSSTFLEFLQSWGVKKSTTTPYNPKGNGLCEKMNGTIWKSVSCLLLDKKLEQDKWSSLLPKALSAIRTLQCRTTRKTPHEMLFQFKRQPISTNISITKKSLKPGDTALLRRFVRNKNEPLGDVVKVIDVFPHYAVIQRPGRAPDTINLQHLAPYPDTVTKDQPSMSTPNPNTLTKDQSSMSPADAIQESFQTTQSTIPIINENSENNNTVVPSPQSVTSGYTTRSGRLSKPPLRFDFDEHY